MSYEEVIWLPVVDQAGKGADALPSIEERQVNSDYLEFLREQIRLEARGPEWREILKERLAHLEPFEGRKLVRVSFHAKPKYAVLEVNPETFEIIHSEIDQ